MSLDRIVNSGVKNINVDKQIQTKPQHVEVVVKKKPVKKPVPDRKQIEKVLSNFKNTRFSYQITDEVNRFIVKIIDKQTDKVIKQIPSEELQKLHVNLKEALGLLFDQEI